MRALTVLAAAALLAGGLSAAPAGSAPADAVVAKKKCPKGKKGKKCRKKGSKKPATGSALKDGKYQLEQDQGPGVEATISGGGTKIKFGKVLLFEPPNDQRCTPTEIDFGGPYPLKKDGATTVRLFVEKIPVPPVEGNGEKGGELKIFGDINTKTGAYYIDYIVRMKNKFHTEGEEPNGCANGGRWEGKLK